MSEMKLAGLYLWNVLAAVATFAGGQAIGACPAPPPAVKSPPGVAYYTDSMHSDRDQTLYQLNRTALAPLDRYLTDIARMSDAHLMGEKDAASCTLSWLTAWASELALLGEPTSGKQARSQRRWAAAAIAISALKVWDAAPERDRSILRAYILRLAQAVQIDAATDKVRNNLLYWAGLVDIVSARLTNNRQLDERAIGICRDAIASLTSQGSLPLEDARGPRAIDYNGFALFPLSLIATLNGRRVPGCSVAGLKPLAYYVLSNRDQTSDLFLRWAPFMGMDVALKPAALFYSYGGGSLPLVASKLAAVAGGTP